MPGPAKTGDSLGMPTANVHFASAYHADASAAPTIATSTGRVVLRTLVCCSCC